LYATLYGQRSEVEPEGQHFLLAADGMWYLRQTPLPADDIMDAFENLDLKCLQLLFSSADEFWDALETSDFNVVQAGLDPEARCSRDAFNDACNQMANPLEQKLIFYYSIRNYNHVAQNIINDILFGLGDAYALLSEPNLHENVSLDDQMHIAGESYRSAASVKCFRIWSNINFCIEKTISLLDFTTKYVFELSKLKPNAMPGKPKARHTTFGDWKGIKLAKDTPLSSMSDDLRLVTALRDETVHNGTIDHFSRIYEHTYGADVKRRFLLLPDHENGRFHTAGGRKRFFHQDNHLNAVLPSLLNSVFVDVLASLREIDSQIANQWEHPESYFDRYPEVAQAMDMAATTGGFLKFTPSDT
jgi:hypothetical protein